jgi:hypothetical protein
MTTTITLIDTIEIDGGFTFDTTTNTLVKIGDRTGYAIAIPGTERVVGTTGITREAFAAAFAEIVIEFGDQLDAGAFVGGWFSEDRGQYIVELSEIHTVDRETAIELGTARHQEAILDVATGEFIETGGHGDAA